MILVPFQNSIVSVTLHKGQLGGVGPQLTPQLQRCFHSQLLNQVNSLTQPLIFKSNFSFPLFAFLLPPPRQGNPSWLKILANPRGNSKSATRFPTCCLFKLRHWTGEFLMAAGTHTIRAPWHLHARLFIKLSSVWDSYCSAADIVYEWHTVVQRCEWIGLLFVSLSHEHCALQMCQV